MKIKRFDSKPSGFVVPTFVCHGFLEERDYEECPGIETSLESDKLERCCLVCRYHKKHRDIYCKNKKGADKDE